jgi:hypothetical protein
LEIQHCIIDDEGEYWSFTSDAEFEKERVRLASNDAVFSTTWTIYGRYLDDGGQFLAMAIGDFSEKDDAFAVMNAILAPMAKARDELLEANRNFDLDDTGKRRAYLTAVQDVTNDLTDFIAQSTDPERL